jgi:hypothetical protein
MADTKSDGLISGVGFLVFALIAVLGAALDLKAWLVPIAVLSAGIVGMKLSKKAENYEKEIKELQREVIARGAQISDLSTEIRNLKSQQPKDQ